MHLLITMKAYYLLFATLCCLIISCSTVKDNAVNNVIEENDATVDTRTLAELTEIKQVSQVVIYQDGKYQVRKPVWVDGVEHSNGSCILEGSGDKGWTLTLSGRWQDGSIDFVRVPICPKTDEDVLNAPYYIVNHTFDLEVSEVRNGKDLSGKRQVSVCGKIFPEAEPELIDITVSWVENSQKIELLWGPHLFYRPLIDENGDIALCSGDPADPE